jgi:hypothetical protein
MTPTEWAMLITLLAGLFIYAVLKGTDYDDKGDN